MKQNLYNYLYQKLIVAENGMLIPERLAIETTNLCNANCIMCPRENMTRPKGIMSKETHSCLLERFYPWRKSIHAISHAGIGEPLMDPSIFEKIKAEKAFFENVMISVYSNGSLLSKTNSLKLLDSGVDHISISLNAYYPDSYAKIMNLKYSHTLSNVKQLIKIKIKKFPDIRISVSIIPQPILQKDEIKKFKNYWSFIADNVIIPPYITWGNHFSMHNRTIDHKAPCIYPWEVMLIDYDGRVKICCEDYDSNLSPGNVFDKAPQELFCSDIFNLYRNKFLEMNFFNPMCKECSETGKDVLLLWQQKAKSTIIKADLL